MAIGSACRRDQAAAGALATLAPGAVVLALALPLLFLHATFQPTLTVALGSTRPQATLADVAVAAVVLAALWSGVRQGFAPLRPGRWTWAALAFLLVWIVVGLALGTRFAAYPWRTNAVTAVKWAEYMLLAPAVPLAVRRRIDLEVVLWSLGLWSAAATFVGVLEFFGAPVATKGPVGHRQASFLGQSDFAALSGAALLAGIVVVLVRAELRSRALGRLLVAAGLLGTILAGALAAMLGLVTALVVLAAILVRRDDRRGARLLAGALVLVVVGSLAIRLPDLTSFNRFLHGKQSYRSNPNKVQTYAHRTLLAYLGVRIWSDHPFLGVGWQGSSDPFAFEPYLPAAHRKFPNESPLAFPSAERRWGVQDLYLQALADLGIVGLIAIASVWAAALAAAARGGGLPGTIAGAWVLFAVWLWTAQGFVAGIPLDALTWLAVGLATAAAAWKVAARA